MTKVSLVIFEEWLSFTLLIIEITDTDNKYLMQKKFNEAYTVCAIYLHRGFHHYPHAWKSLHWKVQQYGEESLMPLFSEGRKHHGAPLIKFYE